MSLCKALISFGNVLHLSHFVASSSQILSLKHSTLIASLEFEELYLHGIRERLTVLQSSLHCTCLWKSNNHDWYHTFWMHSLFNSSKLYYLISRDSKRWIRHPKLTKNESDCCSYINSISFRKKCKNLLTSCFWHPLLPSLQVAEEFGFSSNGFSIYLNRNKTGEILSQNKTLSLLKIK